MVPIRLNVDLGFTTLSQEVANVSLPLEGQVPEWLTGVLIRNGAAKFEIGKEEYQHWFDGLAMLHRFAFDKGEIVYTNRFLRGKTFLAASRKKRIVYPEFATNPRVSLPHRVLLNATGQYTDNASVNVAKVGDSFLALTETPPRVEFNPVNLKTRGQFRYQDRVGGHLTTVHPHYDYKNHEVINYITKFSLTSTYNIYRIKEGSTTRKVFATIPVKQASYMHSFGMTENYVVLTQFPLFINHVRLLGSGGPFVDNLSWKPEYGTNFLVVSKDRGNVIGKFKTDPFFAFHHINCFEKDGTVIVDLNAYKDSSIIRGLYLHKLRGDFLLPTPEMRRYYLDLGSGEVTDEILSQDFVEFPRLNYRQSNTQDYRYVYGLSDQDSNGFPVKLVKFDVKTKEAKQWFRENNYPGEPVFVPTPRAEGEDDGVVLSMVLDTDKRLTYLLVLQADTFTELARAYLPFPVPFGSHGQYFD